MGKREDFALERRTLPIVQQALGLCFMLRASDEQDQKQATDMLIVRVGPQNVAVRVRRPGVERQWRCGPDVTFRLRRPSGIKTEWQKVFEDGAADFMFYGALERECPDVLGRFVVLDLRAMRQQWAASLHSVPVRDSRNRDGTELRAVKTAYLDPGCFMAAFRWPMTPEQIAAAHKPRPAGEGWASAWEPPEVIHMHELGMAEQALMW